MLQISHKDVSILWGQAGAPGYAADLMEQVVVESEVVMGENKLANFGGKISCGVVRNHIPYCL